MAYFLKVKAEEMASPVVVDTKNTADFEDRAINLFNEGKRLNKIAEELGVSIGTMLTFCNEKGIHIDSKCRRTEEINRKIEKERIYWLELKEKYPDMSYNALCQVREYRNHLNFLRRFDKAWTDEHWFYGHKKKGEAKDWKQVDEETLLKVKEVIKAMLEGKPQAICLYSVSKKIGISNMTIKAHLPKCLEEIKKHETPQAEFYARKIAWAIRKIKEEGMVPNWVSVKTLTHIKKEDAIDCLPYLKEIAEPEAYELIQAVLL